MKAISNKKLILSLIKDDLINAKLLSGLNKLGLEAGIYLLSLADTIFVLMDVKDTKQGEALFEHYLKLREKINTINITKSHKALNKLVLQIYNELLSEKPANNN